MNDAFRFSNSILSTKVYQDDIEEYNPAFNNKILSQHKDVIPHVAIINRYYQQLTPCQQYDYYFYAVRKMHRTFPKWGKKLNNDRIELIMKYYDYSYKKAMQVVDLFNDEQYKRIEQLTDIGG